MPISVSLLDTNFSSMKHEVLDVLRKVKIPWKTRRRRSIKLDGFSTMEASHQLRHVFKFFDSNGDGKISPLELSRVLLRLGTRNKLMAAKEAEGMVREMDRNGDGLVDMDEFMMSVLIREDEENLIRDAFMVFDCDKNGYISAGELRKVMVSLDCENCSLKECRKMICGVDRNGDGFVDFEEFKSMMTGFVGR